MLPRIVKTFGGRCMEHRNYNASILSTSSKLFSNKKIEDKKIQKNKIPLTKPTTSQLMSSKYFSSLPSADANESQPPTITEMTEFMAVFPNLVKDLTTFVHKYDLTDASEWLCRAVLYNVPKGKRNRGLLAVSAYKTLISEQMNGQVPDSDDMRRAQYLGWCVEMLQAVFLIADDIMDHSATRRGVPCWYKVPDVGMIAINDSLMIENAIYYVLKEQFGHTDYYMELVELYHEAMMVTTIGESLDLQTASMHIDDFTRTRYTSIVHNKTAFYSFYLPVASAMLMTGFKDPELYRKVKDILYEIGHFFQVQDDILDCYGDPKITGKIGTDIQENKCCWLSVTCMELATPEHKEIMRECYGHNAPEKVAAVRRVYDELELTQLFACYEEDSFKVIKEKIENLPNSISQSIFYQIMDKIYRRDH